MSPTRPRPGRPLWLTYDASADAAYVYLTERIGAGGVGRTITVDPVEVRGMVNPDLDHEDRLIGVEVLDARSRLRADLIASAVVQATPQDLSGTLGAVMDGYKLVLIGEVAPRDGMALELALDSGEQIAEVFEDGATRERSVRFYTDQPVPLEVLQWLLSEAERRL
jgi:uncharacterized protein YuzE